MPPHIIEYLEEMTGWELILATVAILGVLGIIGRWLSKAWPANKKLVEITTVVVSLPERLTAIESTLATINKELHPNHGSSMRDRVDGMQKQLTNQDKKLDRDYSQLQALDTRLSDHIEASEQLVNALTGKDNT